MFRFILESTVVAQVELIKLIRDQTELLARAIQPVLWLVIFGQVLAQVRGIHTGKISYLAYITPGILAQSILFSGIFYGIAIIWERDLGMVQKLLASPALRISLVLGKVTAAGCRGILQAVVIYGVALLMQVDIQLASLAGFAMLGPVMLGSAVFASLSLIIACIVKTRERFMGIGQLLTMPMFFASNAIYPLEIMPSWLQVVARMNPLTYLIDALRGLVINGGEHVHPYSVDFGILAGVFIFLLLVAVKLYPCLAENPY